MVLQYEQSLIIGGPEADSVQSVSEWDDLWRTAHHAPTDGIRGCSGDCGSSYAAQTFGKALGRQLHEIGVPATDGEAVIDRLSGQVPDDMRPVVVGLATNAFHGARVAELIGNKE